MTYVELDTIESTAPVFDTQITYLEPNNPINRRYVSAGAEANTGTYAPYTTQIRDGRSIADHFSLDKHGFVLGHHVSQVKNFLDNDEVGAVYPDEVAAMIKEMTGADLVFPQGWMVRTPGELAKQKKIEGYQHQGGIQPQAGEAHCDFAPDVAEVVAQKYYEQVCPGGKPYKRFISASFWRCFSDGPQDWPLAVCDGRSVTKGEGIKNTLVVVDEIPSMEEMKAPIPGEENMLAAHIYQFNPEHRWWYFSNMNRDEFLYFKFYDSDSGVTQQVPHTAFFDNHAQNPNVRMSIEMRTMAYFY